MPHAFRGPKRLHGRRKTPGPGCLSSSEGNADGKNPIIDLMRTQFKKKTEGKPNPGSLERSGERVETMPKPSRARSDSQQVRRWRKGIGLTAGGVRLPSVPWPAGKTDGIRKLGLAASLKPEFLEKAAEFFGGTTEND